MRMLKIVGFALGGLAALLVLLIVAAALLIHPNAYRGRIERAVQQSTGRSLQLSGDLHLRLFPSIALRFGPASLGNPPGFPNVPFATLREASLHVALLPLLHGELQVGQVDVDGLDARLLTDAQGRGNWQMQPGASAAAPVTATPATAASRSQAATLPEVAGLRVRDARVSYNDLVLQPFDLTVGRVAEGVAVPVSLRLQLHRAEGAPLSLSGSLQVTDQPDAIRVSAIDLQLDQSRLRGDMSVGQQANAPMSFDLHIDQLDLDRYRGAPVPAQHAAPAATPTTTPAAAPLQLPTAMLKTLQLQGTLAIDTLKVAGLTVSQLSLKALAHDGRTQLAPIGAQLYGGSYGGALTLDAHGAIPVLSVQQTLQHIDMARLLQDFAGTQRLSGSGRITAMLSAQGADSSALLHSLDGHVALDVDQGAIQGVDLPFEVARATALLQHAAPPSAQSSGQTAFQTLHASATLRDGVAETHDLNIATQLLRVQGQGTLSLLNDAVNSQLQVTVLKAAAGGAAGAGTVAQIPVAVTGTLASLQVRPDLSQLARSQLQQQVQKQLQRHQNQLPPQVQGVLKGLFGGAHAH